MGILITLIAIGLIGGILITLKLNKEGESTVAPIFLFPFFGGLIAMFILAASSGRSFDEELFTTIDITNEVVNLNGELFVKDPMGSNYLNLKNLHFNEIIQSENSSSYVRYIKRETPRNFWRIRSENSKMILIIKN
jgi:hypothetical protein